MVNHYCPRDVCREDDYEHEALHYESDKGYGRESKKRTPLDVKKPFVDGQTVTLNWDGDVEIK